MKKLLALFLCLTSLFCCSAQAETAGEVVFTEDFENDEHGVILGHCDETLCVMEVATDEDRNKYLHVVTDTGEEANGYVQVHFGPALRNFDYTVRVRPYIKNADWNWLKVVFRADGDIGGSGYENESYLFNIWEWRGCFSIKSTVARKSENNTLVENQDFWFDNGTWYTVKVEARENNIKVYVDGELCVEYTDAEDVRPSGIFGLCSWGANFDIDDITIVSYDDPDAVIKEEAPAEEAAEEVAEEGPINLLPLIAIESGNIQHNEDGSVRVAGRNADNTADAYTDSWHILQRKVADFELAFDYIPDRTGWNMDTISFRCAADENNWNQYQLLLYGDQFGEGKSGLRIVKGEAEDPAFAYVPYEFTSGEKYEIKLVVKGNNVKVYFGIGAISEEAIIDVDLPTADTAEYHDMYIAEGDFQVITWAGDFTMTHMDLTEINE